MQEVANVVRRWFEEVWNQRRVETIEELLTPESVCHADDGHLTGPQEFCERIHEALLTAFPDLHITVDDLITQGESAVVRWTVTGTHTGPGLGLEPSGRAVAFRGITWMRIAHGKLMEGWQSSNLPETLRALSNQTAPAPPAPELGGW